MGRVCYLYFGCLIFLIGGCTRKYVNDYNLGVDFCTLNNYSKAMQHFQDAVIKAPNWADGYYGLGMAYFKSGKLDEAEKNLIKALELESQRSDLLLALGDIYYKQNKKELAAVSFRRSFELSPNMDNAYNLGVVLRELNSYEEAKKSFQFMLDKDSKSSEARINLALCYEAENKLGEARAQWKQIEILNDNETYAALIQAYLTKTGSDKAMMAETPPTLPPVITVYSPAPNADVYENNVQVNVKLLADAGIQDVAILVNDIVLEEKQDPHQIKRGMTIEQPAEVKKLDYLDRQIQLRAGNNEIQIVLTDTEGRNSQTTIPVYRIRPKLYGLFAGISRYKDDKIPALTYADRDAVELYNYFKNQDAFEETNLILLTNEEATRANITEALAYNLSKSSPHDLAIIFLAGHGMQESGEYFFITYDAVQDNLFGTAIKDIEFQSSLKRIGAKRLLLLTDTCHSGGILTQNRGVETASKFFKSLSEVEGRVTITASKFDEVSLEDSRLKHGLFSYYLLEGLDGKADTNADGMIGIMELYRYVSQKIPEASRGSQHPTVILPEGSIVGDVPVAVVKK